MKPSEMPEEVDPARVEAIRRGVRLEDLLLYRYPHLDEQFKAQLPRRYVRLPSPFRAPGDTSKSVLIWMNEESPEREFHWADPLTPSRIPRDVIGFVMAFDGCGYQEAVGILGELLAGWQERDRINGDHLTLVDPPAVATFLAEVQYTRERVGAMGGSLRIFPEEAEEIERKRRKESTLPNVAEELLAVTKSND